MTTPCCTDYLCGSKHERRRGVHSIGEETNCRISVNFTPDPPAGILDPPKMTIEVAALNPHPMKDLMTARQQITELLLDYVDMRRDGARGRLVYDVSASCPGAHRPKNSTSCVVNVKCPFNDQYTNMSVLQLPSEVYKGKRDFHASYLLKSFVLGRISRDTGCRIKICGDEYDVPTVYCDPYVFVTGKRWQDVDQAVEIIKDEIAMHMRNCTCRF